MPSPISATEVGARRGAITDVPGVLVGHHQRLGRGWQTGTTAVLVPGGATPGVDVRGGAPGTRETDSLGPQKLVPSIHGLCLTGGSAYGLRAADGVMDVLAERGLGYPVGPEEHHVVPVVPAAVIFDLGRGGRFDHRPDHGFGARAARSATARQRRWGAVGVGAGARAGGLQGGVGTASRLVTFDPPEVSVPQPGTSRSVQGEPGASCVVGALAVVNSNGAPVDRRSGLPWVPEGWSLRRPHGAEREAVRHALDAPPTSLNTTLGVVATSAALSKSEVALFAMVAHDGLARAVRPAHALVDGDTIFGLATGDVELPDSPRDRSAAVGAGALDGPRRRVEAMGLVLAAVADAFADACTHALLAASTVGALPAYSDLCPSAGRS